VISQILPFSFFSTISSFCSSAIYVFPPENRVSETLL
jgi:hypothetical protein